MIEAAPSFAGLAAFGAGTVVIGAGPVGILTARALRAKGGRVLLLESGRLRPEPAITALSEAESYDPEFHHRPETAAARRLGGTSSLWGGRCLPFDPIDFRDRPWLGAGGVAWPISERDLAPHLGPATEGLGAGRAVFEEKLAGVAADPAFAFETLERWTNTPRTEALHRAELEGDPELMIALGATVLGFHYDDAGRISALDLHLEGQDQNGGREKLAVTGAVVLAGGGNQSTRLLLAEQRRKPGLFGGPDGPLGRFYMGHVNGSIADIVFTDKTLHDGLAYHTDAHGSYVRRRLTPSPATQEAAGLANVAFWPVVPAIANPAHRSGPLSAVFLALTVGPVARKLLAEPIRLKHTGPPPYARGPHVMNVLRDLPATIGFAPLFLWRNRVAKMRLPGFFLTNPGRRYGLEYHSEHLPEASSRLTLGESTDRLGMPRLIHELRFSDKDAASVLAAHGALGDWLARNNLGTLEYYAATPEARAANVFAEAQHGTHQVGTIRMGTDRATAVVDADCRAFDVPNLHVVSTAVLPTSGQANPTLTAVQLGLRLAERIG